MSDTLLPSPPPAPPAPSARHDIGLILAAFTILFAFLSASRIARNSDVYQHLAAGRLIAQNEYNFGGDPFTYTSEDSIWVNHSWLADLALYHLHGLIGGAGLGAVKALVLAGLAAVLLCVRLPRSSASLPASMTLLAFLAMSSRLVALQPAALSYAFLGVSLWLIWRGRAIQGAAWKRFGPLLMLFALWANLDGWFMLGPLLVLLFWLGDMGERIVRRGNEPLALPHWLVPASWLICLLNPYGVHVFTLPLELSPVLEQSGLAFDARFRLAYSSPWEVGVRLSPLLAVSLADWAYFLLFGVSALSFALNRRQLNGGRLAVWLVFAVLGEWQMRTVPFFAVIAAPLAVLNFQDWASRRATLCRGAFARVHFAAFTAALGLNLLACLGWLGGFGVEGRQTAWGLHEEPSLRRMAETVRRWREEKRLGEDERGFAFHPDAAHYLAWFCPGEKSFLDHRFNLNPEAAREFEGVCQELNPFLAKETRRVKLRDGWQEVFRRHGIAFAILYDADTRVLLPGITALVEDRAQWNVLSVTGQAMLFGWRDAPRGPSARAFDNVRLDPERLAFQGGGEPAPDEGPGQPPRKPQPWEMIFRTELPRSWESGASTVYLRWFEADKSADDARAKRMGWAIFAAGLSAAPPRLESGTPLVLDLVTKLRDPYLFTGMLPRSPALPLLSIRAARTALAENPDDINASVRLGQAYYQLVHNLTPESSPGSRGVLLDMLRHIQIAAALEQALAADATLVPAHAILAELYMRRGYYDAALEHRKAQLRLMQQGRQDSALAALLSRARDETAALEREVQDRENQYVLRSRTLKDDVEAQARLASELGLPKRALDKILLPSDALLFGLGGAKLQLELMLMLGRPAPVGEMLERYVKDVKEKLDKFTVLLPSAAGPLVPFQLPAYEWLVACQAAAVGDYARAQVTLREILDFLEGDDRRKVPQLRRDLSLLIATELGISSPHSALSSLIPVQNLREQASLSLMRAAWQRAGRAELEFLAALLALEQGQIQLAEEQFAEALSLARREPKHVSLGTRGLAEAYWKLLRAQRPR